MKAHLAQALLLKVALSHWVILKFLIFWLMIVKEVRFRVDLGIKIRPFLKFCVLFWTLLSL